jgi:calcineurin-like phosphoesterase family protein
MIWLIGDTHFFHQNIIKYCDRPFDNVEQMNRTIITNWNKIVSPEDIVFHLGDVILGRKDLLLPIVSQLNGDKRLIRGNHDRDVSDGKFKEAGFTEIFEKHVCIPESGVVLSHAPILSYSGLFNIHAHTHNTDPTAKYPFYSLDTHKCVSVEMTDYMPISIQSILEEVKLGENKKS